MASKRNAALEALGAAPRQSEPDQIEVPPSSAKPSKAVSKVMVYMPAKVARKFKEIAFTEERKANDVYLDALDLYLKKHGHGGIKDVSGR